MLYCKFATVSAVLLPPHTHTCRFSTSRFRRSAFFSSDAAGCTPRRRLLPLASPYGYRRKPPDHTSTHFDVISGRSRHRRRRLVCSYALVIGQGGGVDIGGCGGCMRSPIPSGARCSPRRAGCGRRLRRARLPPLRRRELTLSPLLLISRFGCWGSCRSVALCDFIVYHC